MGEEVDADLRAISRSVLAEMSAGFRGAWVAALEYQGRNPDVMAAALKAPTDFAEAAGQMVVQFAALHPTILRTAVAHCRAVEAEFAAGIDVRGGTYDPLVSGNGDVGGDQQQDRVAELEHENDELRRALRMVQAIVREVTAVPLDTPTSASVSQCP